MRVPTTTNPQHPLPPAPVTTPGLPVGGGLGEWGTTLGVASLQATSVADRGEGVAITLASCAAVSAPCAVSVFCQGPQYCYCCCYYNNVTVSSFL